MPTETDILKEQVKVLQKQMDEMRGPLPTAISLAALEERITNIEETEPEAFASDAFTPDISRSGDLMDSRKMSPSMESGLKVLPFDIEFGKPTANVTVDSTIVTLQPCDENGVSFASADEVDVYVATDRSTQDIASRGWTTSTILSFYRFSPFVTGPPVVDGVLIGGGATLDDLHKIKVTSNDTTPGFALDKIIGEAIWIQFVEVNDAGDEDLRGEHIGPNEADTFKMTDFEPTKGLLGIFDIEVDKRGHIVAVQDSGLTWHKTSDQ